IKFENGPLEQTYKFRDGEGVDNFSDVERLVDNTLINTVLAEFSQMHRVRQDALKRYRPLAKEDDEFDDII
ncbi:MAG: hypothetical protein AAFP19_12025, partial [Bacteroidota bacterium]